MRIVTLALTLSAAVALLSCTDDDGTNENPKRRRDAGAAAVVADPGPGGILVTVSGEALAIGGYAFPPPPNGVGFVDGWEVRLSRVLVTVDKIVVSENPDRSPTDPSQTEGIVAGADGPWAVDLHRGGPLEGKGGGDERAVAIASLTAQNRAGGAAFDPTKRYAFGFDVVAASAAAKRVNLDEDGTRDYEDMIRNGYSVLYVGTATFKGTTCTSSNANYDFSKLPPVVNFKFGFTSPTTYLNCQNPDNDPARAFAGEEHQRGVQVKTNQSVVAQITIHTDHPFWESVVHDSPAHFDPIAARYVGVDAGAPTAKLEDLVGVDFTAFKDARGAALPSRSCSPSYTAQPGTLTFDTRGVPVDVAGAPDRALRDYRDFMTYNQSTQGHLNADGLCFVRRAYPSPR